MVAPNERSDALLGVDKVEGGLLADIPSPNVLSGALLIGCYVAILLVIFSFSLSTALTFPTYTYPSRSNYVLSAPISTVSTPWSPIATKGHQIRPLLEATLHFPFSGPCILFILLQRQRKNTLLQSHLQPRLLFIFVPPTAQCRNRARRDEPNFCDQHRDMCVRGEIIKWSDEL